MFRDQTLKRQCEKVAAGKWKKKKSQGPLHDKLEKSISFLMLHLLINAPVLLKYWVLVGRKGCREVQKSSIEKKNVPWPFYPTAKRWIKQFELFKHCSRALTSAVNSCRYVRSLICDPDLKKTALENRKWGFVKLIKTCMHIKENIERSSESLLS